MFPRTDLAISKDLYIKKRLIFRLFTVGDQWQLYIIATKEYIFHPLDNPSELQGEGTSAKFVFLVVILFIYYFMLLYFLHLGNYHCRYYFPRKDLSNQQVATADKR